MWREKKQQQQLLPRPLFPSSCEFQIVRMTRRGSGRIGWEICVSPNHHACILCDGIYDFLLSRSRIGTYYVELRLRGSGVLGLTCCFYPCGDAPLLSRHGDWIYHRAKFMMRNPVAMAAQQRLVRLTKAPLRLFNRGSNCGINVNRGFLSGIVMG